MAQEHSPFESMPLDLHFIVLRHMSTPEDVLATVQASPAALSALDTGREQIYAAVLQTCLPTEILHEFLAIVKATDLKCPNIEAPTDDWAAASRSILREWKVWQENVVDFLRSHRGANYALPNPRTKPTDFKAQIKFIVRLYFCLAKFVNFYPTFARGQATGTRFSFPNAAQDDNEVPPLNEAELLRLRRGLLRYELCCRLVGISSVAACQNRQVFATIIRPGPQLPAQHYDIWTGNPFTRFLPTDEVEEIICASIYVHGVYKSLHCNFVEGFSNAILEFSQTRNEEARDKDRSGVKEKTMREWLWDNRLDYYLLPECSDGGFGSRLGLAFLDRVTRSTPTDRREFMRSAFHTFGRPYTLFLRHHDNFLRDSWHSVVARRRSLPGNGTASLELGPHCNPIFQTFITHDETTRLLAGNEQTPDPIINKIRSMGWVFFDDESRLRSLGLPHDCKPSSIDDWERWKRWNYPPFSNANISGSALATRLTEDEWREVMEKYSPKDRRHDFQAMSRFVAGARAVVDFTSDKLPQLA